MTETDPRPKKPPNTPEVIDGGFENFDEIEVIGSGGNADVTKVGYHGEGPETVALKQPRIQGTMDVDSMDRFLEEAETWDKIDDHDHIVGVLDWDSEPVPWIALEYMDGGSLQDRLGELDAAEALWVGVCLCRAVRHAHRRGIAHLDLKPENVLFRETDGDTWDYPKVADWGLAKMLLEHSKSIEGMSPKYAAPEQFDEETYGKPDDFTDIYSVGAVVYAALTGEPPFTGTAASVMQSVLNDEPVPPSERVDGLPEGTDEVVLKALEKRKEDRYESILDFRRDLEALVDEILREQKNQQSDDMVGTGQSASGKDDEEQDPFIYSQRKKSDSLSKRRTSGRDGPKKSSLSRKGNENKDRSEEGSKDQSSLTLVRALGALVILIAAVGVAIVAVDIGDEADSGVSSTNERTVAVVVGLDTEAQQDVSDTLSQDEQRLLQRAQLAPEGLSSSERQRVEELQQEMNQSQQEAIEEASSEFESAVDSTDTVSVDGRIQEETSIIYLVSGISPEITNLLNHENVQSVISKDQYNQLARQQSKSTDE